ncbi:site-specific integrase [Companilactobacillus sp.]|jgi:integrase|uniref:site-specific integrase n=1 Tax=Companilactobacillus sp. TaxID=2767905 RepID=UPI0025BFE928|nr:site-specific integrase [Companilactobacillus sp.]MCH4010030.1 site-specific integrase [Companilactobacillus sp.]MCH4052294.1 site-specific integrase [Companilactobacillus sp.]MCH4077972.1 site-specific integrase [Companilactobacillus sp.]MCH4126548.1 site-specific integrase [Companilactobacillus sp.]MCH4132134.1 site-specific integrase [Companilactobacillus sp.]
MRRSKSNILFYKYYEEWIELYKVNAIRNVTLEKYYMTLKWITKLAPELKLCDLNRRAYQTLMNDYAVSHEKQTTQDFHHQVKSAVMDAVDEGLIKQNPTRKIVIKGKKPAKKKPKFLSQYEVQQLIRQLNLSDQLNWDWYILLVVKTGMRFAEALALTPDDFDFSKQLISVNKTWNYRLTTGGFQPTKNPSSVRKIQIDWQLAMQFSQMMKDLPNDKPIFVHGRIFNSTVNKRLESVCHAANIPVITVHGLRHTHASLLLFGGVSIASVAKRLGHANMTTTQDTYLHIIQELETRDNDKIMREMAVLM